MELAEFSRIKIRLNEDETKQIFSRLCLNCIINASVYYSGMRQIARITDR